LSKFISSAAFSPRPNLLAILKGYHPREDADRQASRDKASCQGVELRGCFEIWVNMKGRISNYIRVALPAFLLFWFFSSVAELFQLYQKREVLVLIEGKRQLVADFNAFYNAGLLCRNYFEHGTPFYDVATQMTSLATVIAPQKSDVMMLSVNPPHYFLLCEPLTYLSVYNAWLIWSAISVLCLVGALYLLDLKQLPNRYEQVCCWIGCFSASTTFSTIRHGQNSLMLLAATLVFWRLLEARKFFLAGLSIALCMFKPQYLPALCSVGLLVGRLRFALGALLAALTVGIISCTAFGWNIFKSWLDFIQLKDSHPDFAYMMQNIRGEMTIWMGGRDDSVGTAASAVILGLSLVFIAWLWYRFRDRWHETFTLRLLAALTTSVMLFCSPHTQINDYVLFYITCIWTWSYIRQTQLNGLSNMLLKALIISYPYASWVLLLLHSLFLVARIQPFLAWNLAVLVLTMPLLFRSQIAAVAK
jgi:Glycosyltransferase family 87